MKTAACSPNRTMRDMLVLVLAALLTLGASEAMASTYDFYRISNNASQDIGSQLSVEVEGFGTDKVLFTFKNNVGIASSITDIYFDDLGAKSTSASNLFSSIKMHDDSGLSVAFDSSATPKNLPGGKTVSPAFVADFSGDSYVPITYFGVNGVDEWVSFVGKLNTGETLDGVLTALTLGNFRVGLHVQGIGISGNSDAYINNVSPVPLPAAAWLFGSAVAGFMVMSRRRRT